ncbi:unnamed protein product [Gongylonema pulchrum]|uniref:RING-type E3 ubiquitin transferase n=1 Tax=Gongylonema pulchrum TaxID=637853 RepID=A0A183DTY2_9BILA|nr:unnamed protein product [Gongylonema pulchrum]
MGQIASLGRSNAANVPSAVDDEDEKCEMHRFSSHPGAFFGSYFLLGGERYDLAKPEAFLFGENTDLDVLGNKPVQFPYSSQPVNDPVRTLNALINLRRDSLKLTKSKCGSSDGAKNSLCLEFYFDCDSACYVQIHFFAKEFISDGRVQYMHYENGSYFPIVIEIRAVDCGIEQMQSTMASIERATDQCASFVVKPLRQKLVADGVVYLLQEIYGIENKEQDLGDENGSECIICMSDIRDTVILPCRHLCICNGCAETLRYKLNNCPICRSPFRALLQLKTMRVVSTVSITDQLPSSQQTRSQTRYETMTLVEALNGPVSHIQSCVVPTAQLGYNIDTCHDFATSLNSKTTRRSSRTSTGIQQVPASNNNRVFKYWTFLFITDTDEHWEKAIRIVLLRQVLTLGNQGRNRKEDGTICIEMKPTDQYVKANSVDFELQEEELSGGCSTSRCCPTSPPDIPYSPVSSHRRRHKKERTLSRHEDSKHLTEGDSRELARRNSDTATADSRNS